MRPAVKSAMPEDEDDRHEMWLALFILSAAAFLAGSIVWAVLR